MRLPASSAAATGQGPAMPSLHQIRLATGLVPNTYVTLHFANHGLGQHLCLGDGERRPPRASGGPAV
jgi:hypothetical protein